MRKLHDYEWKLHKYNQHAHSAKKFAAPLTKTLSEKSLTQEATQLLKHDFSAPTANRNFPTSAATTYNIHALIVPLK
jgi:hypothetical protein